MTPYRTLLATLALLAQSPALRAADLTAYTEEWAPYNYSERGDIKGIATDILRASCSAAELSCDIRVVPWARAYATVAATPNTLLYTTARKPSREAEFLWIGPVLPRATWVYGRAGMEHAIRSTKDLPLLRFGVVRGDAATQDLLEAGVMPKALAAEASNEAVLRQMQKGRVDATVDTEIGMAWSLRVVALPGLEPVKLVQLSERQAYYFALNPKSEPALAGRLQRALEQLRASGKIDAIVRHYTTDVTGALSRQPSR